MRGARTRTRDYVHALDAGCDGPSMDHQRTAFEVQAEETWAGLERSGGGAAGGPPGSVQTRGERGPLGGGHWHTAPPVGVGSDWRRERGWAAVGPVRS